MIIKDSKYKTLLNILLGAIILAVALHIFWQMIAFVLNTDNRVVNDIVNRFGLDEELSFPTWVNSMLAFVASGLAAMVGFSQTKKPKRHTWFVIAMVGLFISIDEVAALHELVLQGLHILAKFGEGKQSIVANAWILVLPFLIAGAVYLINLIYKNLPKNTRKNLILGISIYLLGAIVIEYLSIPFDKSSLVYNLGMVVIEEALEMFGVWLVIAAILTHIQKHEKDLDEKLTSLL